MVQKIFSALTVLMALLTGCERYTKGEQSFTSLKIEGKEYKTPVMYENKHYITGGKELFDFDGDSFKIRLEETRDHYYKIDGRFAFTAREEHSGRIIEIKEGTFHNAMFVNRPGLTISTNWRKK